MGIGSGGHNIKSVKEHKEKGNFRPVRHGNRLEITSPPLKTVPKPPEWFDKDHVEVWKITSEKLIKHEILTEHDYDAVQMYCEFTILRRLAIEDLKKNGMSYETETGAIKANPSVALVMQFTNTLMALMDRFGFNPKSRQGLKKAESKTDKKDPFAFLFN